MVSRSLMLSVGLAVGVAQAAPQEPAPLFGDWFYIMPDGWRDTSARGADPCDAVPQYRVDNGVTYLPVNQPGAGHGGPTYEPGAWYAWYAQCLAESFYDSGAPVSIMIRNRNCPFPYATDGRPVEPDVLRHALDNLPKLDYLVMDLEPWGTNGVEMVQLNVEEVVRMVREHPNPKINSAFIGNYGDLPSARDETQIWPSQRDRTRFTIGGSDPWDRAAFYHQHLNLAMPIAYPYEAYSRHSDAPIQGANNVTPNDRAAIFWAPLERVSSAARDLPDGHALIPWVSNYVATGASPTFYHAPPPTWADLEAMVQHIRMRGATSYFLWTPNNSNTHHPDMDYATFRPYALESWTMLDPYFDDANRVEFLNLSTEKSNPVQWSGIRVGDVVYVLVSNMDESEDRTARLPAIGGLPYETPPVRPGEHMLLFYHVSPGVRDYNLDGVINRDDWIAFVLSMRQRDIEWPNDVAGRGADWRDTDGNGQVDLRDLITVAMAYFRGEFDSWADGRPSPDGDTQGQ